MGAQKEETHLHGVSCTGGSSGNPHLSLRRFPRALQGAPRGPSGGPPGILRMPPGAPRGAPRGSGPLRGPQGILWGAPGGPQGAPKGSSGGPQGTVGGPLEPLTNEFAHERRPYKGPLGGHLGPLVCCLCCLLFAC